MATYNIGKEFQVQENIDSPVIARVREIADSGTFAAYTLKYRHPRFKNKFSNPSFCAWFKINGTRYSEIEDSLAELERELTSSYLVPAAPALIR